MNSIPQGAEVFIGGKLIGKTPTGFVEFKSATVAIKKDGYFDHEELIDIKGGTKTVHPTVTLKSISEEDKCKAEYEKQLVEFLYVSPLIVTLGFGYSGETLKSTNTFLISLNASIEKKVYGWFGIKATIAGHSYSKPDDTGTKSGQPNTSEAYI